MTTYLGKSCSFGLPRVPFVNCRQFMYLVISLLVLWAGCGILLYQFLIFAIILLCLSLFYAFHILNIQKGIFGNFFFEKSYLTVLNFKWLFQREFDYHNLFQKSLFISNFRPLGLLQETILFKKNYIFSLLSSTILVWLYDNAKGKKELHLFPSKRHHFGFMLWQCQGPFALL